MKLNEARDLAISLMKEHGIWSNWNFEFDNAKRRFGCCNYRYKTITLSAPLTEINEVSRVRNTILHEIAHALCPKQKHNHVWKAKAREIGCDGERCYSSKDVETIQGNYSATCVGCGKVHQRFRKAKYSSSCGNCSGGRYNEKYKLEWAKN
jgi:predicted SprT family Zn-dependent metalloprotease